MNIEQYLNSIPGLSSVNRTISAQTVNPNDNGTLRYADFFPLASVPTVKVGDITVGRYRPVASRREWNAPGRLIPVKTPSVRDVEIIPIEPYFVIGEKEMQTLEEQSGGNDSVILARIGEGFAERTDQLAAAIYNRVEMDAMGLWANGVLVQDDPQTGKTFSTDFAFGSDRQQTANPAWTSSTAYAEFLAWLKDGVNAVGRIGGVMLSPAKFALIRASVPLTTGVVASRQYLTDRIIDEIGNDFVFIENSDTLDPFDDGGTATTNTLVWPVNKLAAVPVNGSIGITAKAPVVRAAQLARSNADAGIDRNGVVVFYESLNEGKGLKVSAQANIMSIPNKGQIWTIDVGTP